MPFFVCVEYLISFLIVLDKWGIAQLDSLPSYLSIKKISLVKSFSEIGEEFCWRENPQSISQFESDFYLRNKSGSASLENRQIHCRPLWWKGCEDLTHFDLHFFLSSLSSKPKSCLGRPAVCGSPGLILHSFLSPISLFYDYICMYLHIICQFGESNLAQFFSFQELPLTCMFPFDLHGIH